MSSLLITEERQVYELPSFNQHFKIHPVGWFIERIGKVVYRTSRIDSNLCYELQLPQHTPYLEGKESLKRVKGVESGVLSFFHGII
jgi:hypothetical protein